MQNYYATILDTKNKVKNLYGDIISVQIKSLVYAGNKYILWTNTKNYSRVLKNTQGRYTVKGRQNWRSNQTVLPLFYGFALRWKGWYRQLN